MLHTEVVARPEEALPRVYFQVLCCLIAEGLTYAVIIQVGAGKWDVSSGKGEVVCGKA